eukprot:PLAT6795.2.p1 GENE.PLAT6795.2~~PLAT6795.2.p1  ORF type:complete len:339 (+),score=137.76 PLAT6795.2:74-1090(+)
MDNPFADDSNPFATAAAAEDSHNPFADPALVDGAHGSLPGENLDDALDGGLDKPLLGGSGGSSSRSGGGGGGGRVDPDREAALARKEAELKRREAELMRRENELPDDYKPKNWPRCYPILHHNIEDDIPADKRNLVRFHYYTWMVTVAALFWNFFTCAAMFGTAKPQNVTDFADPWWIVMPMLYVGLGSWLGWTAWYRALYNAMQSDRSASFFWYFVVFLVHTLFCYMQALGVPIFYSTGLLVMIEVDTWGTNTGGESSKPVSYSGISTMCTVSFILWLLLSIVSTYLLRTVHGEYKHRGAAGAAVVKGQATRAGASMASSAAKATLAASEGGASSAV